MYVIILQIFLMEWNAHDMIIYIQGNVSSFSLQLDRRTGFVKVGLQIFLSIKLCIQHI
jgi:hypothetical protein